MKRIVVDTSVVLAFYLPAEPYKAQALALLADHAAGAVQFDTTSLAMYEILNVLSRCVRGLKPGGAMSADQASAVLAAIEGLDLGIHDIVGQRKVLDLAVRLDRSAYDAAFIALAEELDTDLVTGDERLWRGVRDRVPRVLWIGDYVRAGGAE